MKVVIQRADKASVIINDETVAGMSKGLLVLVGIIEEDAEEDIQWMSNKITNLRIFDDEEDIPNLSVKDVGGDIILVSQFTLHARTRKGNRPSYVDAAKPEIAIPLYEKFIKQVEIDLGKPVQTGEFGAHMKVELVNDGPITIIIDSKNKL